MSFEESLVKNASPTLANIKASNLYNFHFATAEEADDAINHFNSLMNPKGIYVDFVRREKDFYLIFVYRVSKVKNILANEEVHSFLMEKGFPDTGDVYGYIDVLKKKMAKGEDFPHEIGVFLGYPLPEVKAFIETGGRDCKFCGDWKAYHDEQYARCMYCKYKHCKEVYVRTYLGGRRFSDMLVASRNSARRTA